MYLLAAGVAACGMVRVGMHGPFQVERPDGNPVRHARPPASTTAGFPGKYEHLYAGLGYDREGFDAALATRLVVVPTRTWGW